MRKTTHYLLPVFGLWITLALAGCSSGTDSADEGDADESAAHDNPLEEGTSDGAPEPEVLPNYVASPYPLTTCVVMGNEFGSMGDPVSYDHEGREVMFCCANCLPEFQSDPATYIQKIDDAILVQQLPNYPMETCLISGDALGDEATNFIYENRLVRLCCDMCIEAFLKNPDGYLAKLNDAAVEIQLPDYPSDACPISGGALGSMGEPINLMVGDRLVRLCCDGCLQPVEDDPAGMLDKVYGEGSDTEAE